MEKDMGTETFWTTCIALSASMKGTDQGLVLANKSSSSMTEYCNDSQHHAGGGEVYS